MQWSVLCRSRRELSNKIAIQMSIYMYFLFTMYLQRLASIQPRTSPVKFARPSGAMRCKNGALNLSGTFETQLTSDMISGERPAWTQKILSSMVAARGSALKTSQKVFHIFTLGRMALRQASESYERRGVIIRKDNYGFYEKSLCLPGRLGGSLAISMDL